MIDKIPSRQHVIATSINGTKTGDNSVQSNVQATINHGEKATNSGLTKAEEKKDKAIHEKQIQDIVKKINEKLIHDNTSLKFEIHEDLDRYYVKVIDDETKETIKEIPPKKMLDYYAAMRENMGLEIDTRV
ncbi:flagellar protein FlaG [Caldibacillus lycopersici]|uniref:Flagellar protein FlaG n=1 Tax=Perspicuibacillus lycopersici TaxID=1325689 RepID=A0AAE3IRP9_9BACI|nr:flagellar protein FlaG [Perspicuibacillus lycopersici]MCU9612977.1 flagellar protein FlaG [Perspicuibacillus lycopersici]